jgi:hypothetical protein
MDIDANNVLYGASGDDVTNGKPGFLYKIDKQTAALTDIGSIVCSGEKIREVDGISFNLVDNTLWGWGQDQGLFMIPRVNNDPNAELNMNACQILLTGPDELEDLTWDDAGNTLYAVGNVSDGDHDASNDDDKTRAIIAYSPATSAISQVCSTALEPITSEIEGMEMQPDGTLMFTYHDENKVSVYGYIDPNSCMLYPGLDMPNPTPYNDIEALACCVDKGSDLPWTYQKDYVGDATGFNIFEIYGMAVKIEGGVMTVAINANMNGQNPLPYKEKVINFSDMVFDFSGTKYAVHFAEQGSDSGVSGMGLYADVTLKDVTGQNEGWKSFKAYNRGNLGALPIQNDYFSWDATRSVPMSIASGTKVADITSLSEAELLAMGLNFAGKGISGGNYTFGFSFQMTADMKGDFLAYFFTECINDGMAIIVKPEGSC